MRNFHYGYLFLQRRLYFEYREIVIVNQVTLVPLTNQEERERDLIPASIHLRCRTSGKIVVEKKCVRLAYGNIESLTTATTTSRTSNQQ